MAIFKRKAPETVEVKGYPLICPICKNNLFHERDTVIPGVGFSPFRYIRATGFVCSECTHVLWFMA